MSEAISSIPNPAALSLPAIYTVGTYYDVGYAVGARFSGVIEEFITKAPSMVDTLVPFYQSDHGRQIYEEYLSATRDYYPQFVREMQGLADGSGRSFYEVFLLHIAPEITELLGKNEEIFKSQIGSCTTLLLNYVDMNGKQQTILAHNEDPDNEMRKLTYVVHARIILHEDSPSPCEEWSAFCYPGNLAGNCFSVNGSGLATSINTLFPKNVQRGKIPYYIATRALLMAKSIDDAESMIVKSRDRVALGMSVSLAYASVANSEQVLANIEVAPTDDDAPYGQANYHVKRLPVALRKEDGFYYHFNTYDRIPGVNAHVPPSSVHRKTRLEALPIPSNLNDILAILGDTKDEQFPIYRSGKAPDYAFTSATGVFDLVESTLSIYKGNPSNGSQGPVMKIPIPNAKSAHTS